MHLLGGQPARAPEILSIRVSNTVYGGVRNVLIIQNTVAFVVSYHKGMQNSSTAKRIFRWLPQEVGDLLIRYLWLVLPFYQALAATSHRLAGGLPLVRSPYLWSTELLRQQAASSTSPDPDPNSAWVL